MFSFASTALCINRQVPIGRGAIAIIAVVGLRRPKGRYVLKGINAYDRILSSLSFTLSIPELTSFLLLSACHMLLLHPGKGNIINTVFNNVVVCVVPCANLTHCK